MIQWKLYLTDIFQLTTEMDRGSQENEQHTETYNKTQ